MFLIVGLGNPGTQYEKTRHNAGFLAVDILLKQVEAQKPKQKHKAVFWESMYKGEKLIIAKPQTFMNLSGESVQELVNWYKIDVQTQLIVIYDDIDLDEGAIRIRPKGSAGTHNGMKSIIHCLQNDNFARVRIGVGKNPPYMQLADYVLARFENNETVMDGLKNAAYAALEIVQNGVDSAQKGYNKK